MTRYEQEQAIGQDLALCDLVEAIGSKSAKRKAKAQHAVCMAQVREWNKADGLEAMTADEIMEALKA